MMDHVGKNYNTDGGDRTVIGGVLGMILAVPAAALLKLLVPLFYQTLNRRARRRGLARARDNADSGAS